MSDHQPNSANSSTEEDLFAVTIGTPTQLNNTVYLADYDPDWPLIFAQLAQEIQQVLGNTIYRLEHVGSTSVPGLAAKPIIDMVLAVLSSADEAAYVPQLESLGYGLRIREPDWYEHRVLKLKKPQVNLHVFSSGCEEIDRMIAFRDWLRSHPNDKHLYETTKRTLSQQTWKYIQNYADAKSAVVQEIMGRAHSGQ